MTPGDIGTLSHAIIVAQIMWAAWVVWAAYSCIDTVVAILLTDDSVWKFEKLVLLLSIYTTGNSGAS